MQTSWQRDLAQEIRIQRSCTSGPTRSWCRHRDREILRKRSADRDLAQVLLRDARRSWHRHLAQEILIHRSCTSAPKGFCWGDLKHLAQEILIQRSCTRGPTGPWCKDSGAEILRKRSAYRDLAQVVTQDPDAEVLTQRYVQEVRIQKSCASSLTEEVLTQTSCARDPHTPILRKCSYRILLRRS